MLLADGAELRMMATFRNEWVFDVQFAGGARFAVSALSPAFEACRVRGALIIWQVRRGDIAFA